MLRSLDLPAKVKSTPLEPPRAGMEGEELQRAWKEWIKVETWRRYVRSTPLLEDDSPLTMNAVKTPSQRQLYCLLGGSRVCDRDQLGATALSQRYGSRPPFRRPSLELAERRRMARTSAFTLRAAAFALPRHLARLDESHRAGA